MRVLARLFGGKLRRLVISLENSREVFLDQRLHAGSLLPGDPVSGR
jgi:hypothetical protein